MQRMDFDNAFYGKLETKFAEFTVQSCQVYSPILAGLLYGLAQNGAFSIIFL